MDKGLIRPSWADLTVQILVVDENSSGRACCALGVAGACVGGSNGAERAIELSCEVVVLPSAAMFAGELPNLLVVLAGAAILTGNGFGG